MSKKQGKRKTNQPDILMNDGWGDVETISKTCYQRMSICSIVIPVTESFRAQPELVKNNLEVSKACLALINDIPEMRRELDAITKKHADKKGHVRETDDFLAAIEVSQMYSSWLDRFERLVDPNLELVAAYVDSFKDKESGNVGE